MALLEASGKRTPDYAEALRKSLVQEHIAVESSRLRGAQAGYRPFEDIRKSLYALTEDNLSFLRRLGLVKVEGKRLVLPTASKRLLSLWKDGQVDVVRRLVTVRILSSGYVAYLQFLVNLERIGGSFRLLAHGQKRTAASPVRRRLQDAGFKTDVASFYTLRDLLYDLQLVNFVVDTDKKSETIFLTSKLTQAGKKSTGFRRSLMVKGYRISFDRCVSEPAFCASLIEGYKALSAVWARWVGLLNLRDAVTIRLGITDQAFDDLLLRILKEDLCDGFKVEGSAGYRSSKRTYGSIIKSKKMPLMPGNRPVQYVAIARHT